MGAHVFMGPRGAEEWIKAPAPRTPFQAVGWSETTQGRNGILTGSHSRNTHMSYELSWPIVDTAIARKVEDWFYGTYSDGLIHWLDPMLTNVLPARWSYPGLTCTDGRPLYGSQRPRAQATDTNVKGLPRKSAYYVYDQFAPLPEWCYVPVPPGYAAHIGVHYGDNGATSSIVFAQKFAGDIPIGNPTNLPALGTTDLRRYSTVFTYGGTGGGYPMSGIGIKIHPGAPLPTGGVAPTGGAIAGIMVEVLPIGVAPQGTGFIRGGGNNGCRMFNPPSTAPISAVYDKTSLSAVLEEVGL